MNKFKVKIVFSWIVYFFVLSFIFLMSAGIEIFCAYDIVCWRDGNKSIDIQPIEIFVLAIIISAILSFAIVLYRSNL